MCHFNVISCQQAFDPDEQGRPNSEVWFSMDSEYFKISATSGSISTTDRVLFVDDVERLEVEVTLHDRGTPPMSSDVTIVIIIQDVEDFSPVFEYLEYTASIQENYVALNFLMLRVSNIILYFILIGAVKSMDQLGSNTCQQPLGPLQRLL